MFIRESRIKNQKKERNETTGLTVIEEKERKKERKKEAAIRAIRKTRYQRQAPRFLYDNCKQNDAHDAVCNWLAKQTSFLQIIQCTITTRFVS